MRSVVSIALPALLAGAVFFKAAAVPTTDGPYELVSFACDNCNRRLVARVASLAECQRTAYGMNDGSDVFISVSLRASQKYECRRPAN